MIRFSGVTKQFGTIGALDDVTLTLDAGEFVLLTGPSGAGKTTFLRMIYAADRPDSGDIVLADWNITRLRAGSVPYLRRNIGVIFQDFKLLPERSALDNVALTLEIQGIGRKEVRQRSEAALEAVGLGDRVDARAGSLSGGEQQRVAIARAVVGSPSILLADEPTGNLDPEMALGILDLLAEIARMGTTVLLATHDPLVVQNAACSRTIMLDRGKLVGNRIFSGPKPCADVPRLDRDEPEDDANEAADQAIDEHEPSQEETGG